MNERRDVSEDRFWEKGIEFAFREAGLRRGETRLETIERVTGASSRVRLVPREAEEPEIRRIPGLERQAIEGGDPRYAVLGEISRSERSTVLEALDRDLGRTVALKVLPEDRAADEAAARRLLDQARIGGQLQHPGIVPVYGLGSGADGRPFFAMKLVAGKTLAALLERAEEREGVDLLSVFEQVCQAVAYAHARGVRHGDLSPENVVVGRFGEVLVVDWGRAVVGGDLRGDVAALGEMLEAILAASGDRDEELAAAARSCAKPDPDAGPADAGDVALAVGGRLAAREEQARLAEVESATEKARARAERAREAAERRQVDRERRSRLRTSTAAAAMILALLVGGGLALGKSAADRAARERAEAGVADAMREAARAEGEGDLVGALAWAHQAAALARSEVVGPETASRASALLERLGLEERLGREDAVLLSGIEEFRIAFLEEAEPDPVALDEAYREAFHGCGIDVESMSPEAAAEAIRSRSRPLEVVAALDDWAHLRWNRRDLAGTDGDRIALVARLADPDEWRNRLRDATRDPDPEEVRSLAATADVGMLPARTLQLLARLLDRVGDPEAAVEVLERALVHHPRDVRLLDDLGERHFVLGRTGEAVACEMAALAIRPESPYLWNALGRVRYYHGEREEALAALQRAAEVGPDLFRPALNVGNILGQLGRREEAESWYRRAIAIAPENPEGYEELGCNYYHLGRPADAEAAFRAALQRDEGYARAWIDLGDALEAQGRREEALEAHERATEVDPENERCWAKLAECRHRGGKLEAAIEAYRRHLEVVPDDARARVNFAVALNGTGARDEALSVLLRAAEISPDWALLRTNLGVQYAMMGEPGKGIPHFRAASRADPHHVPAWLFLGMALGDTGEERAAADAYREGLASNPGKPALELNLVWLLLTAKDEGVRGYEEAAELAEDILRRSGKPREWVVLAVARCRLEQYEAAKEAAERAGEIGGGDGAWRDLVLAVSEAKLGRREAAAGLLERADAWMAENEPGDPLRAFRAEAGSILEEGR